MTKKRIIFVVKLLVMIVVFVYVGIKLKEAWQSIDEKKISIDWRFAPIAVVALIGNMLTSALVWRWLASKMGHRGHTLGLIAAYTFSQMGKYVPGKVALLLMRIERAARYGMPKRTVTLSTLLENMIFMISGGLTGMVAIAHVAGELRPAMQALVWPVTLAMVIILTTACHPRVFYGLVNRVLVKMKRVPVTKEDQLSSSTLTRALLGFLPCWIFGGIAMWATTCCLHPTNIANVGWFAGAYALSVIIGMASLFPGGIGVREVVLGAAITLQLTPVMGHDKAAILALVAVALQRFYQVIVEVALGLGGMAVTSFAKPVAEGEEIRMTKFE
jgi:uncharacterized membrane protein YbhN (UPF0104 family)